MHNSQLCRQDFSINGVNKSKRTRRLWRNGEPHSNVPVLMPGESTPIHCVAVRLRRDDQPLFGHAELDRDALVLDPNRGNNVVDLRQTK